MISDAIFGLLKADATVSKLVGPNGKGVNIFPMRLPEAKKQGIVYSQISGAGVESLAGSNPLQSGRFEIACYAAEYRDARAMKVAAMAVLIGYQGTTSDGTQIDSIRKVLEVDGYNDGPQLFNCPFDVEIWFSETNPNT